MMLPGGWLCQCCRNVWAPFVAICPACNASGQMNDEIRAMHDCPMWGPRVDKIHRDMIPHTVGDFAAAFRVEPRPEIRTGSDAVRLTVITACASCDMPLDHCKRVRGGQGTCCEACDHLGAERTKGKR